MEEEIKDAVVIEPTKKITGTLVDKFTATIEELEKMYPIENVQAIVNVLDERVHMISLEDTFKDMCCTNEEFTVEVYDFSEAKEDGIEYILVKIIDEDNNFAELITEKD